MSTCIVFDLWLYCSFHTTCLCKRFIVMVTFWLKSFKLTLKPQMLSVLLLLKLEHFTYTFKSDIMLTESVLMHHLHANMFCHKSTVFSDSVFFLPSCCILECGYDWRWGEAVQCVPAWLSLIHVSQKYITRFSFCVSCMYVVIHIVFFCRHEYIYLGFIFFHNIVVN